MVKENEICFCSVAFGFNYTNAQKRLSESITKTHPLSTQLFFTDRLPEKSKQHTESFYGFKVHAINEARLLGFTKIVWVDPAIIVLKQLLHLFDLCKTYGVLAVYDDNFLADYCSDKAFAYYGVTRELAKELKLHFAGGSYYLFDFDVLLCENIFDLWEEAESDGIFGKQGEPLQGHRSDEACIALSLFRFGSQLINRDLVGYKTGRDDQIVLKDYSKW